jgi:hypothetical protein
MPDRTFAEVDANVEQELRWLQILYQYNLSALAKPAPNGSCAAMWRNPSCSS